MTDALFGVDQVRGAAGPVEQATRQSAAAASHLTAVHTGAVEALAALAWSIDAARAAGKFYGVAQAGPPYTELARSLQLLPDDGKGTDDAADAWLRSLASPTLGDPAQP